MSSVTGQRNMPPAETQASSIKREREELLSAMSAAGFETFIAWVSADDVSALGDTGLSAPATVGTPSFPCNIHSATPIVRSILATNNGGPLAINLLAADAAWLTEAGVETISVPLQKANPSAVWLFAVPYPERCGFCVAASPRPVDRAGGDAAFGALARHFSTHMSRHPVRPPSASDTYADRFSPREREILHWCSMGKTNWEVSQILDLSENTVRFHWKKIFKKFDVSSRSAATRAALDRGVIKQVLSSRKAALTEMYRSFVEGDPKPLRALLADDVVLVATAPQELFAHGGRYEGPEGVLAHAAAVDREYACRRFLPRLMAEDGDEVAVYLEVELLHRDTGRLMSFDCAHFWTFRDDKVVHYVELFNTAHAHQQRTGGTLQSDGP